MRKRKTRGFTSIKENAGIHQTKRISGRMILGPLILKYPNIQDYLFSLVTRSELVFEDMDFSIEEFSDISGIDLEELLEEINQIVKSR